LQPAVFNELIVAVRDLPGALKTWVDDQGFELIAEAPGAPLARMLNVPAEKIGQSALLGLDAAPARLLLVQLAGEQGNIREGPVSTSMVCFELVGQLAPSNDERHAGLSTALSINPDPAKEQAFFTAVLGFQCIPAHTLGRRHDAAFGILGISVRAAALAPIRAAAREHGSVWRDIGAIGGVLGDGQGIELEAPSGLRVWVYRRFG